MCKKRRRTHVSTFVYYTRPKVFPTPGVVLESVAYAFLDGLLRSASSHISQELLSLTNALDIRIELSKVRYKLHADFKRVHGTNHEYGEKSAGPRKRRKHNATVPGPMKYAARQRYL